MDKIYAIDHKKRSYCSFLVNIGKHPVFGTVGVVEGENGGSVVRSALLKMHAILTHFLNKSIVELAIVPYQYKNGRNVDVDQYEIQCESRS